jgi:hypothetical protein
VGDARRNLAERSVGFQILTAHKSVDCTAHNQFNFVKSPCLLLRESLGSKSLVSPACAICAQTQRLISGLKKVQSLVLMAGSDFLTTPVCRLLRKKKPIPSACNTLGASPTSGSIGSSVGTWSTVKHKTIIALYLKQGRQGCVVFPLLDVTSTEYSGTLPKVPSLARAFSLEAAIKVLRLAK